MPGKWLNTERLDAISAISTAMLATAGISSVPAPTLELPKKILVISADITLCTKLGMIYFGDDMTRWGIAKIWRAAGIASGAGLLGGYVTAQVIDAVLSEVTNQHF